ncbi:hypothetical protein NX862_18635 [Rhodobacter sp. KR11]|jgi:hypothetical protein|uniref:hypothetical protein n=1 Tax=Rhodobacter sp. KR11 TaxID=2974588 RepID=UPI002222AF31|nr:hypothetical protein [Rhodobacter sp. KR11]MCW1920780.1 hypothetical protein [Rhodobacter sp. KR11]
MALVLVLAGLIPGLVAAGLALAGGAGFLLALAAYMAAGLAGMVLAAGLALSRAERRGQRAALSLVRPLP